MNNCLVTKLKALVDNPNLKTMEEALIKVRKTTNPEDYQLGINITSSGGYQMTCDGNGYFTVNSPDAEHEVTHDFLSGLSVVYFANEDFNVKISSKYNITKISYKGSGSAERIPSIDLSDFEYNTKMIELDLRRGYANKGNLSGLSKMSALTTLALIYGKYTGNIDSLPNNITYLELNNIDTINGGENYIPSNNATRLVCSCANASLNLANLVNCNQLQELTLNDSNSYGNISNLNALSSLITANVTNTQVTGRLSELNSLSIQTLRLIGAKLTPSSIEDFVATLISAGRNIKTNPIKIWGLFEHCTFGGNTYPYNYDGAYLDYDSATKITVYLTASTIANAYRIYAKNATPEEIAAWENAGKTVVVVE